MNLQRDAFSRHRLAALGAPKGSHHGLRNGAAHAGRDHADRTTVNRAASAYKTVNHRLFHGTVQVGSLRRHDFGLMGTLGASQRLANYEIC